MLADERAAGERTRFTARGADTRALGAVLVLDGNQRSALAVTRSLGRRGVPVIVADETEGTLAGSSRYCRARVTYPSPYRRPEEFLAALRAEIVRWCAGVVLPMTEVTTELLLEHREMLEGSVVPSGTGESFRTLTDKWRLYQIARDAKVRMPLTSLVRSRAELAATLSGARFPLVLKARRSRVASADGWHAPEVQYARTREEAFRLWSGSKVFQEHGVLLQEYVAGEGRGVSCLYDQARCVAAFGHRRIREKPPSGGVSVLSESVPIDASMMAMATAVLDRVGWHGVAMVEFKVDGDGRPHLIEVNARFWGTVQLAVEAGVDFPWLLYRLATGSSLGEVSSYRVGLRNRWLLGDLDHLLLVWRASGAVGSKLRSLARFARVWARGTRYEINRWDDLSPALFELWAYARSLVRRRGGGPKAQ